MMNEIQEGRVGSVDRGCMMASSANIVVVVLGVLIAVAFGSLHAAEFSFGKVEEMHYIRMEGKIERGDHDKLLSLIRRDPSRAVVVRQIKLASIGGDVSEAIKIALEIEKSGMTATVDNGHICASACVLIYMASPQRSTAYGEILIHRPYFSGSDSSSQIERADEQRSATLDIRNFLYARSIPSYLIDAMMSYPSSEAYQLTNEDVNRIGFLNAQAEELAITRCDVSNSTFRRMLESSYRRCVRDDVMMGLQYRYLVELLGQETAYRSLIEADEKMKAGEL